MTLCTYIIHIAVPCGGRAPSYKIPHSYRTVWWIPVRHWIVSHRSALNMRSKCGISESLDNVGSILWAAQKATDLSGLLRDCSDSAMCFPDVYTVRCADKLLNEYSVKTRNSREDSLAGYCSFSLQIQMCQFKPGQSGMKSKCCWPKSKWYLAWEFKVRQLF